jgi:hypothetical protein
MCHSICAAVILLAFTLSTISFAFSPSHIRCRKDTTRPYKGAFIAMQQENENEVDYELDELSPPSISFTKNSILFGDNPPTEKNNGPLLLWQQTKSILPNFVTGAWKESDGDRDPVEYLYNLVFVRLPVVLMGVVYCNNLIHGHGLYMNVGHGSSPFEVPAVVVFGVIYVILR